MNPLISKARKPKFELHLRILDLNNVPLTSGTCHIKWNLPSSITAEHRGTTPKSPIKEHKVLWDYSRTVPIRLTIDKNNQLQECTIHFEVVQDYSSGGRGEKITLGFVELNLAEYVEESELGADGEEGVVRRYLMQESKINSTLKIAILMRQIEGERNFVAPPLKTAAVFGGIAGIMAGEQVEPDDPGHMPTVRDKPRDNGELQDMYRRALAASWACSGNELPADECVEDIFNGGDGWKDKKPNKKASTSDFEGGDLNDGRRRMHHHHHRTHSGSSIKSQSTITEKRGLRSGHRPSNSRDNIPRSKITNDTSSENSPGRKRVWHRPEHELDELEVREDLVAWSLPLEKGNW